MQRNDLQAAHFPTRRRGNKAHDGRITTDRPNEMWGTDATAVWTRREGLVTVFLAVDHCTSECIGLHAAAVGTRFEALEVIRQGVREQFGGFSADAAAGLALRHDHGSQFMSRDYQEEIRFLGIRSTPSFVAEPQCNGVAERFVRTLKEQCLWLHTFEDAEDVPPRPHGVQGDVQPRVDGGEAWPSFADGGPSSTDRSESRMTSATGCIRTGLSIPSAGRSRLARPPGLVGIQHADCPENPGALHSRRGRWSPREWQLHQESNGGTDDRPSHRYRQSRRQNEERAVHVRG